MKKILGSLLLCGSLSISYFGCQDTDDTRAKGTERDTQKEQGKKSRTETEEPGVSAYIGSCQFLEHTCQDLYGLLPSTKIEKAKEDFKDYCSGTNKKILTQRCDQSSAASFCSLKWSNSKSKYTLIESYQYIGSLQGDSEAEGSCGKASNLFVGEPFKASGSGVFSKEAPLPPVPAE